MSERRQQTDGRDQPVMGLQEVDHTHLGLVGGKGAALGELTRLDGVGVPPGFCVTTGVFHQVLVGIPDMDTWLDGLTALDPDDREGLAALCGRLRVAIEVAPVPAGAAVQIAAAVEQIGGPAWAVRSSATAEDLPEASFAGQHDSYLGIVGSDEVLRHISRCWASLFTERAAAYRRRLGIDARQVAMAVVVQRMVAAEAAGTLFTADPLTGNRRVAVVEAVPGLGDALVSGTVAPDAYEVLRGEVVSRRFTDERAAADTAAGARVLDDAPLLDLVVLGRRIESHLGAPQDIEWCLGPDGFEVTQSRPITTLYPVPDTGDDDRRVFVSVGHGQMMTDAMTPLGLSVHQLIALPTMYEAGGRLFVDVAPRLASPEGRAATIEMLGRGDPLIGDALRTLVDRGDIPEASSASDVPRAAVPPAEAPTPDPIEVDPAVVTELVAQNQASVEALRRDLAGLSGVERLAFIEADIVELRRLLFDPRSHQVFMSAMEATWWLNEHLEAWLGERNVADVLTRSAPHNVTSEMGLALLDVADVARRHPEVVRYLERVEAGEVDGGRFLDGLDGMAGGREVRAAIEGFLDTYGMRCVGEIDITRPRWRERPELVVPMLLADVRNAGPGEAGRRFEQGRLEAEAKADEVLERVHALPDGEARAAEVEARIDRVRTYIGYREYPKYGMVSRTALYKQAIMAEAEDLCRTGVVDEPEDVFFLRFEELREVVRRRRVDRSLIGQRRAAFRRYQGLTPPRVMTSDGEVVTGWYRRGDVPAGALVGVAVSAGTVEGRARVVHDVADAELEPGDILVTGCTDPSWSPVFVTVAGLVTEVGGLMTHGAVVAREYGLPAVVGVVRATELIRDGQRIRLHGTDGYVELLS